MRSFNIGWTNYDNDLREKIFLGDTPREAVDKIYSYAREQGEQVRQVLYVIETITVRAPGDYRPIS